MKVGRRLLAVLLVVVMMVCAVPVAYGTYVVDGGYCGREGDGTNLTWTLDSEGILTISGTGSMNNYDDYGTDAPWGQFYNQIKVVVIGNSVTSIGYYAFYRCYRLTGVTIPDSVISIGDYAFCDCNSLWSVTIPSSVTSIGEYAFKGCSALTSFSVDKNNQSYVSDNYGCLYNKSKTLLIQYTVGNSRTSFIIPDSVTSIGGYAFYRCSSLTSVTIPDSVTSIDDYAFCGFFGLTSVIIPDSVTNIGKRAFGSCYGLTSMIIGNSVISIDLEAFSGCDSLISVVIPDGVMSIGSETFMHCDSLTSVTIPDSVTRIANYAFWDCSSLKDVYYNGTEAQWNNIAIYTGNDCLTNATIHFNSGGSTGGTTAETSTEFNTEHGKASVSLDVRDLEGSAYDFNYYIAQFAVNMSLLTYSPTRTEIAGCLDRLGFDFKGFPGKDTDEKDYCYWPNKENSVLDKNCFVIARKDYVIDGEDKTLVLVMMRGTNGNEWYSNFDPKEGDTHASFDAGAKFVLKHLKNYMRDEGLLNKDNVKMIVTGHSRGAAVANLLGKYINLDGVNGTPKFGFPEEDNVFTYTFATPNVTSNSEATSNLFKTIFNFVNPEDFVTKVMPSKWGYKRYGVTLTLPSKTNDEYYHVFRDNMNIHYREYTGKSYHPYPEGESTVCNIISKITKNVTSVYDFYHAKFWHRGYSKREPYLFFKEELCPLVAKTDDTEKYLSIVSAFYTYASIGADDLYTSIIDFFLLNQIEKPNFETAHCAETYAAFINTMTYDQMYTMGLERKGRYGSVNCPVDVEIIDKETDEVVGRIVDNVVDEEILAKENSVVMTVDGDEKSFWLPSNGDYEVKLIGNDEGTMDYTLAEIDSDAGELGRTNFFDVQLEDGLTYTGELPAEDFVLEEHTLKCENGAEIEPDETFDAENSLGYTVTVNIEGNGTVEGAGTYTSGDYMTLTAIPDEYHVFAGWFVNGELTDEEAQLHGRLPAGTNINATARFVPHPHTYTSTVTTAPWCETSGVRTYTCECGYSYTETIPALGHTAPDEHGNCARCGAHLMDVCPWCGGDHVGFFQGIVAFFHRIFAGIFGARY